MKIRAESAESLDSLADYLKRCTCLVRFVDEQTIDIGLLPQSAGQQHEQVELDGYLRVWQAMNPQSRIERLDPQPSSFEWALGE